MDILIMGAGAIGSLLAYRLGEAGHHVTAVGRAPYVQAVCSRGLLIEQKGRALRAKGLCAVEQVEALGKAKFDLVLITTKAFDTAVAAVQVQPLIRGETRVIVLQNGVGGTEIAGSILGEASLYAGAVTTSVEMLKPAVIRQRSRRGGIGLAAVDGGQDLTSLAELFEHAQFQVQTYPEWRALKWSTLANHMLANAVPAILGWPLEQAYADPRLYALERKALYEARAVIRHMRLKLVQLPGLPGPWSFCTLCILPWWITFLYFRSTILRRYGRGRSQLQIDLDRGKDMSEVEFLNGAVVRAGARVGVRTPVNQALYETLTGIVHGQIDPSEYQGQVDRLLHRVKNKGSTEPPTVPAQNTHKD